MSTLTENDLTDLKNLIISQNQKLEQLANNNKEIRNVLTELAIGQAKLEGKVDTVNARLDAYKPALDKIPDLAEKVGELKNSRQFFGIVVRTILTVAGSVFVGWFLRGVIKV